MQNNVNAELGLSVQESGDRIRINEIGIALLYGIALVAFVGCSIALAINLMLNRGLGGGGAIAGIIDSVFIVALLRTGRVKAAIISILWGFALIPIFGFFSFF